MKILKTTKKNSLTLSDEFIQYCKLNNIEDIDKLAEKTFEKGFNLLKYGDKPFLPQSPSSREGIDLGESGGDQSVMSEITIKDKKIVKVVPMRTSDASEVFKKTPDKSNLYDE